MTAGAHARRAKAGWSGFFPLTPRTNPGYRPGAGVVLISALTACSWLAPRERAPVEGGETLSYIMRSEKGGARGTVTLEKKGRGFLVKSTSPAYPPQRVGPDLRAPRADIAAYNIGVLWLPPSVRALGTRSFAGEVLRTETHDGQLYIVVGATAEQRFFDAETGFLVAIRRMIGPFTETLKLEGTTVPGLRVGQIPGV